MARDANDTTPISSRRELVAGSRPASNPRDPCASERNTKKSRFTRRTRARSYEPAAFALIEGLRAAQGWTPIFDRDA